MKPTALRHYFVNEYFAPIKESIAIPKKKKTIPGRATKGLMRDH